MLTALPLQLNILLLNLDKGEALSTTSARQATIQRT